MSTPKEPLFMALDGVGPHVPVPGWPKTWVADEAAYARLFEAGAGSPWRGESTPLYLWSERAAQRIAETSPDAQMFALMRDPVQRAYSNYLLDRRLGWERRSFRDAIREDDVAPKVLGRFHGYIDFGRYGEQLARYRRTMPARQVHVHLLSELREPRALLARIADVLGIDPAPMEHVRSEVVHNATLVPRGRWAERLLLSHVGRWGATRLPAGVRSRLAGAVFTAPTDPSRPSEEDARWLQGRFEDDLRDLERTLGRRFPELRESWVE